MQTATRTTPPKLTTPSVADDPRWSRIVARDQDRRWTSLVFGSDDGRLLSAIVSVAHDQP
jgi:hypothetical protein